MIRLPVVVIVVADDNGGNNAGDGFSNKTIWELVRDTNEIFEPDAGIRLILQEITTLNNTLINRLTDWSKDCLNARQDIEHPDPIFAAKGCKLSNSQYEAYIHAKSNYPDKIVVFIRRQTYDDNCNVVNEGGGGFSHEDMNFIALSSWDPDNTTHNTLGVMVHNTGPTPAQAPRSYLAHELGHYFDLTHTMPNEWPKNRIDANLHLYEYCIQNSIDPKKAPKNLPDLVWDFDKLSDTPPDPGHYLYNNILYGIEHPNMPTAAGNQCIGSGELKLEFFGQEFTIKPARQNLMSYTAQCPYLPGNTTGETRARITPQQRNIIHASLKNNRKNLMQLTPGPERFSAIWVKSDGPWQWIQGWTQSDLVKAEAENKKKGLRLSRLNAFVLPGHDGTRFNAIWVKSKKSLHWVAAWKQADFEKEQAEYTRRGYRLEDINAYVLPDGQGTRYNAIWVKSDEPWQWILGWTQADLTQADMENRKQGLRLARLNAYVLPGHEGTRFNAIWVKSKEPWHWVAAWKQGDFEKEHAKYEQQGYRLEDLNAYMLPDGQGTRYNAIWVKSDEHRPCVGAWIGWDFQPHCSELLEDGYRLHDLNAFVVT